MADTIRLEIQWDDDDRPVNLRGSYEFSCSNASRIIAGPDSGRSRQWLTQAR